MVSVSRRTALLAGLSLVVAPAVVAPAAAAPPPVGTYGSTSTWSDWARLWIGARAGLASSHDRSGENSDFSQYESPEGLIREERTATVTTIVGPGVVQRIWMPHVTANQAFPVRMFFDDEASPRIATTSDVLFSGAFSYFASPLVDTAAGGQVCYEPIAFAKSLRIETINQEIPVTWSPMRHYYQYSFVRLPVSAGIESYTDQLLPSEQKARNTLIAIYENIGRHPDGESPDSTRLTTPETSIPSGASLSLASLPGPGRIRALYLKLASATDEQLASLLLRVRYDGEPTFAIDASVADFFGAGRDRSPYRSLPLGTASDEGFYSYWPMPFRTAVEVSLHNADDLPVVLDSAVIEYEPYDVPADMAYLRVRVSASTKELGQIYYSVLQTTGRGHYVGSLTYVEQPSESFRMLEGDEVITVDGRDVLQGTGLEDAYNGGYYYNWVAVQNDEPEGPMPRSATRPLYGLLYADKRENYARADQYRWRIPDRVPFAQSLEMTIENRYSVVGATWTTVAFWYQQPNVPGDMDEDGDLDLQDVAVLQNCFGMDTPACLRDFDHDSNERIDLADAAQIVRLLTGAWPRS